MKPIIFEVISRTEKSGEEICDIIRDVNQWSDYKGYGILPGIEKVEYKVRTESMIGTQFAVTNTDGSNHIEEVTEWVDGKIVALKMHEFVFPLDKLTTHFTEVFSFEALASATEISRTFTLYPKNTFARPILWVISLLLRKAIARHSLQMNNK